MTLFIYIYIYFFKKRIRVIFYIYIYFFKKRIRVICSTEDPFHARAVDILVFTKTSHQLGDCIASPLSLLSCDVALWPETQQVIRIVQITRWADFHDEITSFHEIWNNQQKEVVDISRVG
jgi:hypothetical protein